MMSYLISDEQILILAVCSITYPNSCFLTAFDRVVTLRKMLGYCRQVKN